MAGVALAIAVVGLVISAYAAFAANRSANASGRSAEAAGRSAAASEKTVDISKDSLAFQREAAERLVRKERSDLLRAIAKELGLSAWGGSLRVLSGYPDLTEDETDSIFEMAGRYANARPKDVKDMREKWLREKQ